MRQVFKALAYLAFCLTSACNNGADSTPKIGDVSTATISYDGRQITQRNGVRCEFANLNDGVVHIGRAPWIEGDRHWLKRDDGSIIIFPEFQSCMENARPREQRDAMTVSGRFAPLSDTTYLFNNSDKPTSVDLLTADAFTSSTDDARLTSVTLARIDSPMTSKLATAFPGLQRIIPDPGKMATNGLGSDLFPGIFVGVQAQATILASNTKCGTSATSGLVILPEQDLCRFVNDCMKSAPTLVCGKAQGGLRVSFDPSFSRAAVLPGTPDRHYRMTLYDSQLSAFASAPSIKWNDYRKWTPEVCVESLCATPKQPFLPVLFYYPARHLLIEVGPVQRGFSKGMFSDRRVL